MRIAIAGSFCSGKSSVLCNLMGDKPLAEYKIDIGTERRIRALAGAETKISLSDTASYQDALLSQERIHLLSNKNYITDSPLHLILAYTEWGYERGGILPCDYIRLTADARRYLPLYDLVFLCEPLAFVANDGHRDTDKTMQAEIHKKLCKIIGAFGQYARLALLPPVSVEERLEIFRRTFKESVK